MIKINSIKVVTEFVDDSTGEIFTDERILGEETKKAKKSTSTRTKKPKDDNDPNPKATLLEGKIQLNNAAMELTGWEPEMKIDIRFEKKGKLMTPIMCEDAAKGNRLTKSNTISCRGSKHDNLSDFGNVFEVVAYEGKNGFFKLIGDNQPEDDIVELPEELSSPEEEDDFDLSEMNMEDISFEL